MDNDTKSKLSQNNGDLLLRGKEEHQQKASSFWRNFDKAESLCQVNCRVAAKILKKYVPKNYEGTLCSHLVFQLAKNYTVIKIGPFGHAQIYNTIRPLWENANCKKVDVSV